MRIYKNFQELVDAIARAIVPDLDYKANNLEPLTGEDIRGILDSAAEQIGSYQREVSDRINAERRALKRDAENSQFEFPQEIREILAKDRGEGRI